MTQHNIDLLEKHKHHYETLVRAGYLRGLNQHEKNDLLHVARTEFFGVNYNPDMWCGQCVLDAVTAIYRAYENYLKSKPKETVIKQSNSF